jgi:hypothetical protein
LLPCLLREGWGCRSFLFAEMSEEVTYAEVPVAALWEVANFLKLAPEIDFAAADYDPAAERPALVDELLQWGAEQKERKLTLASKLEWETYKVEDLDTLTDMQEQERVACERCGFIFKMYARSPCIAQITERELSMYV